MITIITLYILYTISICISFYNVGIERKTITLADAISSAIVAIILMFGLYYNI